MKEDTTTAVQAYIKAAHLGKAYQAQVPAVFYPLAEWMADQHHDRPVIIGINGAQGSGKSTLTGLLQVLLEREFGKRVAAFSIDDLYLTKAQRQSLAKSVHPLFLTRGVPGTHDVALGMNILRQLSSYRNGSVKIPVFDKGTDDRLPDDRWQTVLCPVNIILFEGWCAGAIAQPEQDLATPVNELEAVQDRDATWRTYVNNQLKGPYREWFGLIDKLVMLKVPAMEQVYEWRELQETRLGQARGMDTSGLRRFIMHYERLTRYQLQEMPARADVLLELDHTHRVSGIRFR